MLESIIAVAAIEVPARYQPRSVRDEALRFARTCYDHLAGEVGVAVADALVANGSIILRDVSDTSQSLPFMRQSPEDFAAAMQRLGVNTTTRLVTYSTSLVWWARRFGAAASHSAGSPGSAIPARCG